MKMTKQLSAMAAVVGVALLLTPAALADLAPGQSHYNPDAAGGLSPPYYTVGGVGAAAGGYAALTPVLTNPFVQGVYAGTVSSRVWQNGSGELAFEYWFNLIPGGTATTPVESATVGGDWNATTVYEVGADGSGFSSGPTWVDGDPYRIGRKFTGGSPDVEYFVSPVGTQYFPGSSHFAAHFWYATDADSYTIDYLSVQDGGAVDRGQVYVVPAPGAFPLGMIGLGMIGRIRRRLTA